MAERNDVELLGGLIGGSSRILVFTGAGVSTASGIPDYRGPRGVWATRRPVEYGAFMSSREARRTYWQQKLEDREAFGDAAPNAVHLAVVALERAERLEMLVTQNVDGLHAAAGTSPERLVEIHGTTRLVECQRCGIRSDPDESYARFAATGDAPDCDCGGPLKPATISFGQGLRTLDVERAFHAAQQCDLVVSLGSTLTVVPAADIPMAAAQRGVPYAVVNRGETGHDGSRWITVRIDDDVNAVFPAAVTAALTVAREGA